MTELVTELVRIAAFSDGSRGGNPAGVWIGAQLPTAEEMQRIAAEVGFSETAFAAPLHSEGQGAEVRQWRVRYFSPEAEVPFCGHATIALGVALARRFGAGDHALRLSQTQIRVSGWQDEQGQWQAALQSPPTRSKPAPADLMRETLALFGYDAASLDPRIPPAIIHGGADHLVLALKDRATLSAMHYSQAQGRLLMRREGLVTILLGITISSTMTGEAFVNLNTLFIIGLGLVAFIMDTAGGVLFAKLLNVFLPERLKINPMVGAAGISAFPMSARVIHKMGQDEDKGNYLLMPAVSANVAGQIGSVIAGGLILTLVPYFL